MGARDELCWASLRDLAERIRQRQLSPVDLAQSCLKRVEALDDSLHAFITVTRDAALDQARTAEDEIARGQYRGLLHGIPFAVKDQIYTRDVRTTAGSELLRDFVPSVDATAVARMKHAGAVLLGKLNMTEFALGDAYHFPYGEPHNPWNRDYYSGGSSCGSGIATATGMAPVTLGEDTGGSIRNPANMCGVVGLRPTVGLVSRHGVIGADWSADTVGVTARSVESCAITLGVLAGRDERDPTTSRRDVPDYLAELDGEHRGLRIGIVREFRDDHGLHPEVRQAFERSVATMAGLGAQVEEVSIPMVREAGVIWAAGVDAEISLSPHAAWLRSHWNVYSYTSRMRAGLSLLMPPRLVADAAVGRLVLQRQFQEAYSMVDLIMSPSYPTPPPSYAEIESLRDGHQGLEHHLGPARYTSAFATVGSPAISVPCGFTTTGLPLGLQFAARPYEDARMMSAAYAYEQATDFSARRPPT